MQKKIYMKSYMIPVITWAGAFPESLTEKEVE